MQHGPDIARIAALIGDPARARMLTALIGGQALTARELAEEAGVTPQTASSHLSQLREGGLICERKQGRHKYVALAGTEVAATLEALMGLAARSGHLRHRPGPRDKDLRAARSCYRHLAGRAGVTLRDSLSTAGHLATHGDGLILTADGLSRLRQAGLAVPEGLTGRDCLDWSERRSHIGGALGRALLSEMRGAGWLRPADGSRVIAFTPEGAQRFARAFPPA
ncbi:MAG: transcriptional regulator [Rhodobacterales bacterium]|nr:MAG: transcriptional regulator [Rhodobacterales bacterium]